MKKYKFKIRGNPYEVDILKVEDNVAEIEVNGTHYQVEIQSEVKTTKTPVLKRSDVVTTSEADKAKTSKPNEKKGVGFVKAPLPGVILEIKIKVGDEVKFGDVLMIMEAMKMENSIRSDRPGKIKDIKVNIGDSVLEGSVLVEIGS
ncbi:MAG: biotin/lipoyl-binding protein [Ignavibacteriales bacterium]|nr:biotin/lipoyl-binding protein [Ignavibacteriales bacterium]